MVPHEHDSPGSGSSSRLQGSTVIAIDCATDDGTSSAWSGFSGAENGGGRAASPAFSDRPSIYSYASSMDRQFILKDVHGRILNSTNRMYSLPADVDEHGRLDIQHEMLRVAMGDLYMKPEVVRRILAPRPEGAEPPAILDIGTGSGSWALDMAKEFPHAEVVGLDLVPANLAASAPPNCRFECDDVNQGLSHYKNAFDVVHIRCVCTGIEDYQAFLEDVFHIIRPGGILLVFEGDARLYDEDLNLLTGETEDEPGFSWMHKMLNAASAAMRAKGPGIDSPHKIAGWLRDMPCWSETGSKIVPIALGPWKPNMPYEERYPSELLRQDFFRLAASYRPLLLTSGVDEATVDYWIARTREEIYTMNKHMMTTWLAFYALKPNAPAA